ncbi:MAG: nuclear transport factor 2 family protein, partial [Actinomycetota bacterium]|nr:nuclear transport factor 2 family protein [Actinomycetota bacterium]
MQTILSELSTAFQTRDLDGLLALFSTSPIATYAGSETDETATGALALRHLFARLLGRKTIYSFHFPHLIYSEAPGVVWVLGDGEGVETRPHHTAEVFAYRITGVLV